MGGKCLGRIEIGDRLRAEAKEAISELKALGIERTVMLTGDSRARAEKVAGELGMSEVNAGLLPDEKLEKAESLKKDSTLMYVGDGTTTRPSWRWPTVPFPWESWEAPRPWRPLIWFSFPTISKRFPAGFASPERREKSSPKTSCFPIAMKAAFMVLGVAGVMPLWLAVFADVGVMLLAVLNSLRMRMKIKGEGI